ncbi:MAG: helix-turn-helix transcriptional regulator [Betaproteobacteria bacterium]|nr:helix-turn-helix transcriptional regulator [Betaproteobacteria bacterium]MDE2622924.1 helix-turn-helix transcriptional regulator [Betaproteobacteria bacterium]
MDFSVLADAEIERELGSRIKALRLRKNLTQDELAARALLHRNAISTLESGKGSRMSTLIAVLRELGALDHLSSFLPEIPVSPLMLLKNQGKVRKRATRSADVPKTGRDSRW